MTKKTNALAIAIVIAGCFSGLQAQEAPTVSTPAVPDNARPLSDNIKLRSVELERIKRDAEKKATLRREDGKELKFALIKEDFEGIQKEQMSIVHVYTTTDPIDYKAIKESSNKITEMAVRLRANVFAPKEEESGDPSTENEENPYTGKSVRDLIVELDNAIGAVVTSPMWQKLAVVDPETSLVVEGSLAKVIMASSALWIEASKKNSN